MVIFAGLAPAASGGGRGMPQDLFRSGVLFEGLPEWCPLPRGEEESRRVGCGYQGREFLKTPHLQTL